VSRSIIALLPVVFLVVGIAALSAAEPVHPTRYLVDRQRLLWVSEDGGSHWEPAATALSAAVGVEHAPRITAIATVDNHAAELLVAVGAQLFRSVDHARTFTEVDLSAVINPATYVTAIAVAPQDHGHMVVGTSYDGIYHSRDGGATWRDLSIIHPLRPLHLGGGFLEEIAGLRFLDEPDWVVVTLGFGMGTYRVHVDAGTVQRIPPGPANPDPMSRFPHTGIHAGGTRVAAAVGPAALPEADSAATTTVSASGRWGAADRPEPPLGGEEIARHRRASDKRGIYLSPYRAAELDTYLAYLDQKSLNSIVVDFKDDHGRLTYDSALELPAEIGAVEPVFDAAELIRVAHEADIYVIARVVVFKDRKLYAYNSHQYALWDGVANRPWGVFRRVVPPAPEEDAADAAEPAEEPPEPVPYYVQVEHWVDPHAPAVWEYNVAIARELVALGVDEIQFDYIRFPSDGDTSTIVARHAEQGRDRVDALESFLSAARAAIRVPISIDVFGFNGWSRMSYLGQDLSVMARHVDVICPMYYPSHFARAFLPWFGYLDRAEYIYREGARRALKIAESQIGRAHV
jgi:hypothetical protein